MSSTRKRPLHEGAHKVKAEDEQKPPHRPPKA